MTTFRKARYPKTCAVKGCLEHANFGGPLCLRHWRRKQLERDIQARKERRH